MSNDPFAKVATNIIRKSGANLQSESYHKWVTRTVREAAEEHAAEIQTDRNKIWNALVTLAGGPDEAKALIGE